MTALKFYKLTLGILLRIAVMLKLFFKELKLTDLLTLLLISLLFAKTSIALSF